MSVLAGWCAGNVAISVTTSIVTGEAAVCVFFMRSNGVVVVQCVLHDECGCVYAYRSTDAGSGMVLVPYLDFINHHPDAALMKTNFEAGGRSNAIRSYSVKTNKAVMPVRRAPCTSAASGKTQPWR